MVSEGPLPAYALERMRAATRPEAKEDISELPQWVKISLVQRVIGDLTYDEAAKPYGRKGASLADYGRSPAAKAWLAGLTPFLDDPIAMARAILAGSALSITADRLMIYEMAKETNIELADKIARDLQDRMGIVAKKQEAGAISVKINLGGTTLEIPSVEAEWEMIEDGEAKDG